MFSAESSGSRFSNVIPVVDGARRSKSAGGSAERRHPASASAISSRQARSASEETLMIDTSVRSAASFRVHRVAGQLLVAALLVGCSSAGSGSTQSPAPAQSGAAQGATASDIQQSPNQP